jgi:glutaminyl-peptide cyclotransferase
MTTRSGIGEGLGALVLLALSVAPVTAGDAQKPEAKAAAAARVTFDGGRAYEHVRRVVALGPRPAGSPAAAETRAYIKSELKALGIEAVEQPFDADTPLGRFHMVNVIARIPGASPERIVFAGHYDTKLFREFRFVGANDAGSSTAFLLEWARVAKARANRFTTELLFLDGEEAMRSEWLDPDNRYGSRHYVRAGQQDGTLKQVRAMILVDMVGDRDLQIKREENSTRWLKDAIWGAAKRLKQGAVFSDEETAIEDDHMPFLSAGVPAVDIIDLDYYPYWHTKDDTLDKVSARSLQVVGEVLTEALPEIEKKLAVKK